MTEWPAIVPYSWHQPEQPANYASNCQFNNAWNMVSFVDGHVGYIKIYSNSTPYAGGTSSLAVHYGPPTGYDYRWSPD